MVLATIDVHGTPTKVVLNANRNGFFYVLDRTNGKLIAANQYIKTLNWATGIDESGRPIESELSKHMRTTGETTEIWPSVWGGKAWSPSAYSPETGLYYANTLEFGMKYTPTQPQYRAGATYWGADLAWVFPKDGNVGYLRAIEPLTGKSKWEVASAEPRWGGVLVTGGGVVFSGLATGQFEAFDNETGQKLWSFQTGSGVEGQPVTWQQDGVQYVAVATGQGGAYVVYAGDERLANVPAGGSLWVFALYPQTASK